MNRRDFLLRASSLSLLPIVGCHFWDKKSEFPITVHNDMQVGHRLFASPPPKSEKTLPTDTLIVGGGIAGLSAAVALMAGKRDFLVCELSDRWGGTSGAVAYKKLHIAQGAHYELQYPAHFDEALLGFWEDLAVIEFNKKTAHWEFIDEQFIIDGNKEGRTWNGKSYRDDVLPNTTESKTFLAFIEGLFLGKMCLPTRLLAPEFYSLNTFTFSIYLKKHFPAMSANLLRAIDYQMLDDYGGTAAQVSALAGVYYYGSHAYTADENVVFSPPQGNYYFIEKMLAKIPVETRLLNRLIYKIIPQKVGFKVEVLNTQTHTIETIDTKNIIYAGQKHALKHIFPQDFPLFQQTEQAPWLVVNVVLHKPLDKPVFWQNEVIKENQVFLGFVNSLAQHADNQVLSAYYCLKSTDRVKLADVEEKKAYWANYTLQGIADYFQMKTTDLTEQVAHVFIQVMGHAMAIPTPNFLLNDFNAKRSHQQLVYAGADNARLPLMLEATDSGLEASKLLMKHF